MQRAPGSARAATSYAQFLIGEDQLDQAEAVLNKVTAREPDNVRALILQSAIASRQGNVARVNALTARLETLPPGTTEDTLQLAYALRNAGNDQSARRIISNSLIALPTTRTCCYKSPTSSATRAAGMLPSRCIGRFCNSIPTTSKHA
jgi:predicted Zn-dependent protease